MSSGISSALLMMILLFIKIDKLFLVCVIIHGLNVSNTLIRLTNVKRYETYEINYN